MVSLSLLLSYFLACSILCLFMLCDCVTCLFLKFGSLVQSGALSPLGGNGLIYNKVLWQLYDLDSDLDMSCFS